MRFNQVKPSIRYLLVAVLAVLPALVSGGAANTSPTPTEEQRQLFRQLYAQAQEGKVDEIKSHLAELRSYPLYPWLEYQFLLENFENTPDQTLLDFVQRYPNSLMSDGIYVRWARRLTDIRDWSTILRHIPSNSENTATQCYRVEAMLLLGKQDGLAEGKAIWDNASRELPSDCNGMIQQLQKSSALSNDDYWKRIRALMDNNQVSAAQSLGHNLSDTDAALVELWAEVRKSPESKLPDALKLSDSARTREVVVFGLKRVADKKLDSALSLWETAQKTFTFTAAEKGEVESRLGMWEVWKHDDKGLQRLQAIPVQYRSAEGNIWLARMALRTNQWNSLLEATTALESEETDRDIWQYWKARALEQLGQPREANSVYAGLAQNATFYGFLAADRLGQEYTPLKQAVPDRGQRLGGLKKLAIMQRWQEWMALGDRTQARKEWFRALQDMDKEGKLASAGLAIAQGDANLAIWTVSRTKDWNSVDLRFPLLYEQIVMEHARSQGIRPEWILGIMRRESAFDAVAESGAKALGLMQLMPATARDVGRKLGMKVTGKEDILHPTTNVQLGSAYLREMLSRFSGNYAQATAAYNAGPGRIPKWAPDTTLQADQWVESIPFNETRDYVRAVMAYTTVYDHKLNQDKGTRLSVRLGPIKPE